MGHTFEMDDAVSGSINPLLIQLLRVMIGDVTEPYKYTDAELLSIIYVAMYYVNIEVCEDYEVNVEGQTVELTVLDNGAFIELVMLKAACILTKSEQKAAANCSVTFTDGPSNVKLGDMAKNVKAIADDYCDKYSSAKIKYLTGACGGTNPTVGVVSLHDDCCGDSTVK